MLIFMDLETSGLRADTHSVLEVAVIMTDDAFADIARFTAVAHWLYASDLADANSAVRDAFAKFTVDVDPFVLEMHTKNGLWAASMASTMSLDDVDSMLATFIAETCAAHGVVPGEKTGPQLAGNTINFDRAFLQAQLPLTHALLHYRNVDITTLNEVARRFWPAVHKDRPRSAGNVHRAEADVLASLETARYYARTLGPVARAPSSYDL